MAHSRARGRRSSSAGGTLGGSHGGARPSDPSGRWRELGRRSLLAGDAAEALWYLRRAVEDNNEHPVAWWLLGECFEQLGDALRAARCFKLASRQVMTQGIDEEDFEAQVTSATGRRPRRTDS